MAGVHHHLRVGCFQLHALLRQRRACNVLAKSQLAVEVPAKLDVVDHIAALKASFSLPRQRPHRGRVPYKGTVSDEQKRIMSDKYYTLVEAFEELDARGMQASLYQLEKWRQWGYWASRAPYKGAVSEEQKKIMSRTDCSMEETCAELDARGMKASCTQVETWRRDGESMDRPPFEGAICDEQKMIMTNKSWTLAETFAALDARGMRANRAQVKYWRRKGKYSAPLRERCTSADTPAMSDGCGVQEASTSQVNDASQVRMYADRAPYRGPITDEQKKLMANTNLSMVERFAALDARGMQASFSQLRRWKRWGFWTDRASYKGAVSEEQKKIMARTDCSLKETFAELDARGMQASCYQVEMWRRYGELYDRPFFDGAISDEQYKIMADTSLSIREVFAELDARGMQANLSQVTTCRQRDVNRRV
ncbi:hypothetical protein DIPPA_70220 [Diplonema papillatum]|nr:hypothetical protein DIPPA_70220 [Diplonema papillatum]